MSQSKAGRVFCLRSEIRQNIMAEEVGGRGYSPHDEKEAENTQKGTTNKRTSKEVLESSSYSQAPLKKVSTSSQNTYHFLGTKGSTDELGGVDSIFQPGVLCSRGIMVHGAWQVPLRHSEPELYKDGC